MCWSPNPAHHESKRHLSKASSLTRLQETLTLQTPSGAGGRPVEGWAIWQLPDCSLEGRGSTGPSLGLEEDRGGLERPREQLVPEGPLWG